MQRDTLPTNENFNLALLALFFVIASGASEARDIIRQGNTVVVPMRGEVSHHLFFYSPHSKSG